MWCAAISCKCMRMQVSTLIWITLALMISKLMTWVARIQQEQRTPIFTSMIAVKQFTAVIARDVTILSIVTMCMEHAELSTDLLPLLKVTMMLTLQCTIEVVK